MYAGTDGGMLAPTPYGAPGAAVTIGAKPVTDDPGAVVSGGGAVAMLTFTCGCCCCCCCCCCASAARRAFRSAHHAVMLWLRFSLLTPFLRDDAEPPALLGVPLLTVVPAGVLVGVVVPVAGVDGCPLSGGMAESSGAPEAPGPKGL